MKEEEERKEAERVAKEEADRKAKEEADRKAKEEADRKAKEDVSIHLPRFSLILYRLTEKPAKKPKEKRKKR